MKVQPSVKLRCKKCYTTRKDGRLIVRCKTNPRHNQAQG